MHALFFRNNQRTAHVASSSGKSPVHASSDKPAMQTRRPSTAAVSWHQSQKANYYFDASHQSVKTLRVLLAKCQPGTNHPGLSLPSRQLAQSVDVLLASIRPRLGDDGESRDYFLALLRMHLSGLAASELQNLAVILKSLPYDCYVSESMHADKFLLENGVAHGSAYHRLRTLLQTNEFFDLLDELQQQDLRNQTTPTSLRAQALVPIARNWLASCAASWLQSDKTLTEVLCAARQLCVLLEIPTAPDQVLTATPTSRASVLELQNSQLLIESGVARHLGKDENGKLFAYVLRDLLELMLTKKLIHHEALPQQLRPQQRCDLLHCLSQIIDYGRPATVSAVLRSQADKILANANLFGKVQILPTIGAALGHAWITPALSLTSDATGQSSVTGTRFMHTGFQLTARECVIREWPTRFLSSRESENLFPSESTWHVPVPVDAQRLQSAADAVIRDWRELGLAYRFTGIDPTIDATGCRITVWQAIQRGMTADALALFQHYNLGLPEPESPTELWLRLDGMMRWLEHIISPNPASL